MALGQDSSPTKTSTSRCDDAASIPSDPDHCFRPGNSQTILRKLTLLCCTYIEITATAIAMFRFGGNERALCVWGIVHCLSDIGRLPKSNRRKWRLEQFLIEVEFYFFYSDSTNLDGNNFATDNFKARTSVVAFNRITLWSMTPLIVNWSEGEEASNCRLAFIARGDRGGCIGQGRPLVVRSRLGKPLRSFISTKSMRSYAREIILPTF